METQSRRQAQVFSTMSKTQAMSVERRGRKPLALLGRERRDRKVLASFTPSQHAALERLADAEGVTLAELVAQSALDKLP